MKAKRARAGGHTPEAPELRATIIAASVALIEEEGLAKLSMREVARRAGVTHQAPYHHFADREAILGEIAEQGFRILTERVQAADTQASASVAARIVAMGRAYVEFACEHPAHFRIMFRPELVDLDNCPGAQEAGGCAFELLTGIVHQAVAAGLPARVSVDALVATMWSMVHGLACLILDGPLAKKLPAERNEHIDGVLATIRGLLEASMQQPHA